LESVLEAPGRYGGAVIAFDRGVEMAPHLFTPPPPKEALKTGAGGSPGACARDGRLHGYTPAGAGSGASLRRAGAARFL